VIVHCEDLLADPINELERLVNFLCLAGHPSSEDLRRIVSTYQTGQLDANQTSYLHSNMGVIGRFRSYESKTARVV
jgi:hypothetical protein